MAATVHLPAAPAHPGARPRIGAVQLELERVPTPVWVAQVAAWAAAWTAVTALALSTTLDPFAASFPFVLGGALTWHRFHARYRVHAFRASCPACAAQLELARGRRIGLPHTVVCGACTTAAVLDPAR